MGFQNLEIWGGLAKSKYITIYLFLEQTLWAAESSREYPERFLSIWMYLFSKLFGSRLKKMLLKNGHIDPRYGKGKVLSGILILEKIQTIETNLLTVHKKCFEHFSNVILCLWNWQRYKEHVWYPKHTFNMHRKWSGDSQTSFIKFHISFFWRSLISCHPIPESQKKDVWFFMNKVWMSLEHFQGISKVTLSIL